MREKSKIESGKENFQKARRKVDIEKNTRKNIFFNNLNFCMWVHIKEQKIAESNVK